VVMRGRVLLWVGPAAVYLAFVAWYTNLAGPMTGDEIAAVVGRLQANGADPGRVERLRRFMEQDSGSQFIMVNIIDAAENPPDLPATGPGAGAATLMTHYMEHMYPALLRRACHPVFAGSTISDAMDLAGISGAESWTQVALMRYRSRRDMIEIATDPAFGGRHEYKLAALDKTIAVPVETQIYLSDPRLLLALVLLLALLLIERITMIRR
jgi:hypothetical protein